VRGKIPWEKLPHEPRCSTKDSSGPCDCYVAEVGIFDDGTVNEDTLPVWIRQRLFSTPRHVRDAIRNIIGTFEPDPLQEEVLRQLDRLDTRPDAKIIPFPKKKP
jgi:hypothetical protein